jgi:hypothetical protein
MTRTYTVVENGVATTHEASPEMEAIFERIAAFNEKNPDFWCSCASPEAVVFEPRGHSVDVFCRCGGCLQVG